MVAIIAAISLTMRKRKDTTKHQNPSEQIRVKSEDRLRVIKMTSEEKQ